MGTLKAADEELNATQTSHKDATKELGKADASLRAIWGDMQEVCVAQDDLANTLKDFKENIWASFNALKEKEPEPEPVAEEAPGMNTQCLRQRQRQPWMPQQLLWQRHDVEALWDG